MQFLGGDIGQDVVSTVQPLHFIQPKLCVHKKEALPAGFNVGVHVYQIIK
jgi:hypothetical protein